MVVTLNKQNKECDGSCFNRRSSDGQCSVHDEVIRIMEHRDVVNESRETALLTRMGSLETQNNELRNIIAALVANQTTMIQRLDAIEKQQQQQTAMIKGMKILGQFIRWSLAIGGSAAGIWIAFKR